ncbi:MAG: MFS transporter [Candidatus Nanopelagicaceae bacterium]
MFSNYRSIFAIKGAVRFSIAGFVARMHLSMDRLALLLIVIHETGSYALAGLMVATASVVITISQPYWSRAADNFGQGRVLYINTILRFFGFSIFILLVHFQFPIWSWFLSIIFAELNTISAGGLVRRRWIYVLPDHSLKTTAYSFEALVDEIIFVFGPLIATFLSTSIAPEAGLIASMIFVVIGQPALARQRATEPPVNPNQIRSEVSIIKRKSAQAIILPIFFVGAYFGSIGICVVAFMNSINKPGLTGPILAIWALGSAAAALANGTIKWRLTHGQLFIYFLLFLSLTSLGFIFADTAIELAIVLFLNGLGIAPLLVTAFAVMEDEVSPDELTEAMTWVITGTPTGGAIGSAVAGQVIDNFGTTQGFYIPVLALFIANLALLPYLKVWIRLRSRS